MNELIKITKNADGEPVVSGRELHEFLEVRTEYMKWFDRMCEHGFTLNIDFSSILAESTGGRPSTDHAMKLDMAKEIAMLQKNAKGKAARLYFIEVEKRYRQMLPGTYIEALEALLASEKEKERLTAQNARLSIQLDESMEWYTVKRVAKLNNRHWKSLSWRKLKDTSEYLGYDTPKTFDANYGYVNTYHIDVWRQEYPELVYE